jgi:hypothetical protein
MPILLTAWRFRWLIAGGAIVLLIAGLWWRLDVAKADLEIAQSHVAILQSAHKTTINTLDQVETEHRRQLTALEAEAAHHAARARQFNTLRNEVRNEPSDGCVGPAVRRALDGLR